MAEVLRINRTASTNSPEKKTPGRKVARIKPTYKELQQNFETFIALQEGFYFIFSESGELKFASADTLSKIGYVEGESQKPQIFDIFPANQKDAISDLLSRKIQQEPLIFEIPLVHKEGRYLSARTKIISTTWAGKSAFCCLIEETTTRKRLEVELSMLSHALRNVSESLSVFDLKGNIIFINESFVQAYGYTKEELIGQSINKFHPSEKVRQVFKPIIEKSIKDSWEGELIAQRKSGENFTIFLRTSPVMDDAGAPIVIVAVARDITEKKQLEEQLRQSQKMEAIGQLAGGIAHDFNNLLTVIEGYTELLFSNISETDPAQNFVRQIKKATDRATGLTRQLLAFSRRQILQPRVLNLNSLVSEMSVLIKRLIGEDVELTTLLTPDLGSIKADRSQMEQVLMNLAVNARDALPEGGTLTIETREVALDSALYERHQSGIRKGSYVQLSIADNGVGMDQETKERVFEPFFTTKETAKGTGLGLATVYGIVKQSGGHIWVYSEKSVGTTFKIYLPLIRSKAKTNLKKETGRNNLRGNETILVVEDEFMVRELVCDTLRSSGYKVMEAPNGKEAIKVYTQNKEDIDLVLTDVIMPEMSGRKLIESLVKAHPDVVALYMSGYTDDAIIKHGVLEPGMAYIQKPFSPKALIQKVKSVLEEH